MIFFVANQIQATFGGDLKHNSNNISTDASLFRHSGRLYQISKCPLSHSHHDTQGSVKYGVTGVHQSS